MIYDDFDIFISKVKINGILETQTSMHIGSGDERAVLKVRRGSTEVPIIPGSSLKGVLRSEAESWLRSTYDICTPSNLCNQNGEEEYCIICGLFGGFSLGSHMRLIDALPIEDTIPIEIKPGVAINRILSIAEGGVLFPMEIVGPKHKFNFEMILENIELITKDGKMNTSSDDVRVKIIYNILRKLLNGEFQIGAKTSSGLGLIKLIDARLSVTSRGDGIEFLKSQYYQLSLTDELEIEVSS